jgi:hypothetical protein
MKTPILKAGGFGLSTEATFDALMDDLQHEWDETPGAYMGFVVFTARKPMPKASSSTPSWFRPRSLCLSLLSPFCRMFRQLFALVSSYH